MEPLSFDERLAMKRPADLKLPGIEFLEIFEMPVPELPFKGKYRTGTYGVRPDKPKQPFLYRCSREYTSLESWS